MAVRTVKIDDIDGKSEGADTVIFGAAGEYFTADLCEADAGKLQAALEPFVKVGAQVDARDVAKTGGPGYSTSAARAWLNAHNRPQPDRGRISAEDLAIYRRETGN